MNVYSKEKHTDWATEGLYSWQWGLKRKASIDQALPDKKISSLYKELLNNYIVILVWRVFGFYTQIFIIIIIIMSKVRRKPKNADHLKFPLLYLFYFLKNSCKARDTAVVVATHSEAYWCQNRLSNIILTLTLLTYVL